MDTKKILLWAALGYIAYQIYQHGLSELALTASRKEQGSHQGHVGEVSR